MNTQVRDWNVLSMLEWATDYFNKRDIPEPRLSIEWLLAEVLDVNRLDLYLKFDRPLASDELDRLRPLVKRRANHEPLQYILGFTEFMNVRIHVSPAVLIPRIETEQLVEMILDRHPAGAPLKVIDLGTGSGCIPIALKKERPGWSITGVDLSGEALEVARANAAQNNVIVNWLQGDLTAWKDLAVEGPFDLVVSNPPYVLPEEKEHLESQVRDHEPTLALYCSDLDEMYGSIRDFSGKKLAPGGSLYIEVHELHAKEILKHFEGPGWSAEIKKDYAGKHRFILSELNS